MKPDKKIFYKLECMGDPSATDTHHDTVIDFLKTLAKWLMAVTLQRRIVITIGREESDLHAGTRTAAKQDAIIELDELFDSLAKNHGDPNGPN